MMKKGQKAFQKESKLSVPRQYRSFIFLSLAAVFTGMFVIQSMDISEQDAIQTIYISQGSGDDQLNDGSQEDRPIRSLWKAKEIARSSSAQGFEILLKGGEIYDDFQSMTNNVLVDYDAARSLFAFVWDIDKPLLLSTYGSPEKALLYSGKYTFEGGPQAAIAVTSPSTEKVTIKNLHFKRWQVCAIFTYETKNIDILDNIVEEIGTLYFPGETVFDIYGAGALYPKNSTNVLLKGNYIRDIHNEFSRLDEMHAFYLTRLGDSEICDNIIINASGPPLKFRRSQTNHVYVHDNGFYYTGPSKALNCEQEGWVRYSGDEKDGCPYAITIENNKFYYPYCWEDREHCSQAEATKYSISNTKVCGSDACENEEKVKWINNEFRYFWEPFDVPDFPTNVNIFKSERVGNDLYVQNSPNPFSEETSIVYTLKKPDQIRLEIYDIRGRLVRVILDREETSGTHLWNWDGRDDNYHPVPNGIYFCRMEVEGRFITSKMILSR